MRPKDSSGDIWSKARGSDNKAEEVITKHQRGSEMRGFDPAHHPRALTRGQMIVEALPMMRNSVRADPPPPGGGMRGSVLANVGQSSCVCVGIS